MSSHASETGKFTSMEQFAALPRVGGLSLNRDGTRLVASISTLNKDKTTWVASLWDLDPQGLDQARRITRGTEREGSARFLPDGSLLFTSTRDNPEAEGEADKQFTLWRMAPGSEAEALLTRPGSFSSLAVARDTGAIAYSGAVFGPATDLEAEREARKRRKDAGVTAILHTSYPIRNWDHDLGPSRPRIIVLDTPPTDLSDATLPDGREIGGTDGVLPNDEYGGDLQISSDGTFVIVSRLLSSGGPFDQRSVIDRVDVADGTSTTVLDRAGINYSRPAISRDDSTLAVVIETHNTLDDPGADTLALLNLASGEVREVAPARDWQVGTITWSPDGAALYVTADERGHRPVFRVDLHTDEVVRLTASGAYSNVIVGPDGHSIYALRDHIDSPPAPVRLDPGQVDQHPTPIPAPGSVQVPGTVRELESTSADGFVTRSFLVLPEEASSESPAPLLLWIHGGPHSSWNSWSWRWNPWLMAAKGYAVLLPDPALSTGYGHAHLSRAYGSWGELTHADLMAATDAAEALPEIDQSKVAAMGGSFGGYMANWVATKTDRFKAIVTHASLWDLDHFAGSTDFAPYWMRMFGDPVTQPERYAASSPHLGAREITTPMLVIHGDRDYRVPIGQGLRLWSDLQRLGVSSRFLYYPDEGHWVLTPGNHAVWYETVWAFLDEQVHGKDWVQPDLL